MNLSEATPQLDRRPRYTKEQTAAFRAEKLLAAVETICFKAGMASNFFNDIAMLPPSLRLNRWEASRAKPTAVKEKREIFNTQTKMEFLKFLGQNHAVDLSLMGIPHTEIDRMRDEGFFPRDAMGNRLNCSIDHIIPLKFKGTNHFSNLTLVTSKLNALKDKLEQLQWSHDQQAGSIITILPAAHDGGKLLRVPFIPGGFQPRNNHV